MMGGCFAQDATTQTVETYWPTHSVHAAYKRYVFKEKASDLLLPFQAPGLLGGACAENISKPTDKDSLFGWGDWVTGVVDALYVGVDEREAFFTHVSYRRPSHTAYSTMPVSFPVAKMMVEVDSLGSTMRTEQFEFSLTFSVAPSELKDPWPIRLNCMYCECDFVSFWWINDEVQKQYFMVQPMCSVASEPAFFTHGFNILTEL